jgi:diguanylate cyclase (GGDEF)-like protein/PAS domain S-box-containing protein
LFARVRGRGRPEPDSVIDLSEIADHRATIEALDEGVAVIAPDGTVQYLNGSGQQMLRCNAEQLTECLKRNPIGMYREDGSLVPPDERPIRAALEGRRTVAAAYRVERLDGSSVLVKVSTNILRDPEGTMTGVVATCLDVTAEREAEMALRQSEARFAEAAAQLAWQAFHDGLTGLPNRALFLDRLQHALERARRRDELSALLFLDVDRFKLVNDSQGHAVGDAVLVEVAARLSRAVRKGDTVARFGGDEFVILAESLTGTHQAQFLAERILNSLATPIDLSDEQVSITASIGIALDREHDPEALLHDADTALYRAKEKGRDRYEVFDVALRADALRRMATEQMVRHALDEDGLAIHYQPIVDLTTGDVVATEALVRIRDANGHLHSPGEFISVAEETGLIVPVGAGVLQQACAQLARWRRDRGDGAPSRMTVNIASRQLARPNFRDTITRAMESNGLSPADLVLEVTESTVLGADQATAAVVDELHDLGLTLSIDDFGTGYSSLAYLKRFPVDWLKLDRSLIGDLGSDPREAEVVHAVIELARCLGLVVVAEGIETSAQLDELRALGCSCGQGYLLAKPAGGSELSVQSEQIATLFAHA